jgi:hypothetical protein
MFKARVNFSGEPDGNLSGPSKNIHTKMDANAATFAGPPLTMAEFLAFIDAWDLALQKAEDRSRDHITAKNNARTDMEDALRRLGGYVNTIAQGDLATIELSGFPSYDTNHSQTGGGVAFVPQNVRLERTPVSGAVTVKWQGDGSRAVYEVQINTSDPNVAANWSYKGSFTGGRADLSGFTPGATLWVRVRKIGTKGETGGWSDPASIMVT